MTTRPDIVLILTDQQRFDQVGYASGGHFRTPNLDHIARSGVTFENAYSASTVPATVRPMQDSGFHPPATAGWLSRHAADGRIPEPGRPVQPRLRLTATSRLVLAQAAAGPISGTARCRPRHWRPPSGRGTRSRSSERSR
jgi:hypothetical protein